MNARPSHRTFVAGVVLALLLDPASSTISAQQAALRRGQTPGPRFIVPTLRGDESTLGFRVAGALRERLASDFDMRSLLVVPESAITSFLEQSGFSPREPLSAKDTRQLVSQFQAEEFLDGRVFRTPAGGYRVELDWALLRRDDMVQPLPAVEATKISEVAKLLSNELQSARKQIESVRKCVDRARGGDFAGGLAEAHKAISVYPGSVLGRVCIANIYAQQKLGSDSMIRISEEILSLHPQNRRALAFAADAYHAKGMREQQIRMLMTLHSLDSTDWRVHVSAVRALAENKEFERAQPLIDAAVRQNPSDPEPLRLQWLIYLSLKRWNEAVTIGEQLAIADTAAADADYFTRMAAALSEEKQAERAAAVLSRGVRKFPANDELAALEIQLLRRVGQLQPALDAANRLVARNPKAPNAWLQRARTQAELKITADSVIESLSRGLEHGETRATVSGFAATLGQAAARAGNASENVADLRIAVRYFRFAESVQPGDTTAFLLGASNLSLGQQLYAPAREQKSCELAKEMQNAFVEAQVNLPKGGRSFPSAAQQALAQLEGLLPYAATLEKAVCKPRD
jgi:tetratricopeptide (TPR) repeat protein